MEPRAIDRNIAALISDVAELKDRLRKLGDTEGPESEPLLDFVNGYLVLNEPIIQRAVEAWATTPEDDLAALEGDHRELDASAARHHFRDEAMQAVNDARDAIQSPIGSSLLRVDDDQLHMLGRMLDYAKYVANTDDLKLEWSPVARAFDNPEVASVVGILRAQAIDRSERERKAAPPTPPPDEPPPATTSTSPETTAPKPTEDRGRDYRPAATISRDYWTVDDHLGYDFYADAVAAFIQHRDTEPPLTIGIKAPWGAGKTSLMRMIRARLDPTPDSELQPNLAGARTSQRATISNREALDRAKLAREERHVKVDDLAAAGDDDRRPTVWFNAWMYQSAEQVWAGLADAIISQLTARMPTYARERFWAQLNLRRIDTDVVRKRIYAALVQRLLPAALALVVLWALALALRLFPDVRDFAAHVGIGSTVVMGGASYVKWRKFLSEPVAGAFGELVSAPDYKDKVGYMQHVHADMRRVLNLVTTPEQPVVVFVDDLDRCSYDSVAKVIEAINLFLAGEFPNCIFVIAMEPDLVAAQIEVAYKDVFETVKEDLPEREQAQLGWRFLEKMVQLPLSLPPPSTDQVAELIDSILTGKAAKPVALDAGAVQRAREHISEVVRTREVPAAVDDLQAISQAAKHLAGRPDFKPETLIKAAEAEFDERFSDTDPVVQQAIREHASALSRNPREIKRFINVFRFYSFIQVRRDLRDLESPSYEQLAKLSALAIHWPHLLGLFGQVVDDGTSVLAFLEAAAGEALAAEADALARDGRDGRAAKAGADAWSAGVERGKFPAGRCHDLLAPDLRVLLAQEPMIGSSASGFL